MTIKNSFKNQIRLLTSFFLFFAIMNNTSATITENSDPRDMLYLVSNAKAMAEVVVPDDAEDVVLDAAKELIAIVEKSSGVRMKLLPESRVSEQEHLRVFIGPTQVAAQAGVMPDEDVDEQSIIEVVDGNLYVTGNGYGVYYGVLELLERYVGVVWAWPGELGTYVPQHRSIGVPSGISMRFAPALTMRFIRTNSFLRWREYDDRTERIGFSRDCLNQYGKDLAVYQKRHRIDGYAKGFTLPSPNHAFKNWWRRYGKKHPEWFYMSKDGKRPGHTGKHVPMCVSNPGLHDEIIKRWLVGQRDMRSYFRGRHVVTIGESDVGGICHCPVCKSWDPEVPEYTFWSGVESASERYARFWKEILRRAKEHRDDAMVSVFMYLQTFPAPRTPIELGEDVIGFFCQWGDDRISWFPMEDESLEWMKAQWLGWSATGMRMVYRPNYLHDGYVMPHVDTRQSGEFFQFAYRNGMVGTDFDSLRGQHANQGPQLYMTYRLHTRPEMDIDDILDEYYSVFGPAAAQVRAYFTYWENYSIEQQDRWRNEVFAGLGSRWARFQLKAHEAYPPDSFAPAQALLNDAAKAAAEHPDSQYRERIAFLQAGLEHARLCARLAALFDGERNIPMNTEREFEARKVVRELVQFRKAHEYLYIDDFSESARFERVQWNVDDLFEDALTNYEIVPWTEDWLFRKDPDNKGIAETWYAADTDPDDDWRKIDVPTSWQDTWVGTENGNYYGYGWYRTRILLPKQKTGCKLKLVLVFKGVDEQAWVYLNGVQVGEHSVVSEKSSIGQLWNSQFIIEVDDRQVQPGQVNDLYVRVHASVHGAGIWQPVIVLVRQVEVMDERDPNVY